MAEPSQPTSCIYLYLSKHLFTTAEKPKNLIVINYECPPDPNHINHILEILINVTRLYAQTDMSKAQSIENYITQITPQLYSLYDQSVKQMLTHTQSTFHSPKDTYIPHTNGILQKLLDELKQMTISVNKGKEKRRTNHF